MKSLFKQYFTGTPKSERSLVTTTTGELLQPIRLHYELFNKKELLRIFNKLDCISLDAPRQRWVWMYAKETRTLKFKRS